MDNEKIKIYCTRCKGYTNHKVRAKVSKHLTSENDPELATLEIDFHTEIWEILECKGCEEITFRETWFNSENIDYETDLPELHIRLFPPRNENSLPKRSHFNLPQNLHQIYQEMIEAYNNDLDILCAMGIRTLIEGVCLNKGIKNGPVQNKTGAIARKDNLEGKIQGMVESGFLTQEHAITLHELRFLGNDAVHELKTPSSDELQIAIEIVEHTLENLYELTEKADTLRREKQIRSE